MKLGEEAYVELHPDEAAKVNLNGGRRVRVIRDSDSNRRTFYHLQGNHERKSIL
jgi:hypothetical protein